MARKTIRGQVRDIKHGRNPIKRKVQRSSPKQRFRRAATKAIGHPTTVKGWKSSSKSFYRRNFGCVGLLLMLLSVFSLLVILIIVAI